LNPIAQSILTTSTLLLSPMGHWGSCSACFLVPRGGSCRPHSCSDVLRTNMRINKKPLFAPPAWSTRQTRYSGVRAKAFGGGDSRSLRITRLVTDHRYRNRLKFVGAGCKNQSFTSQRLIQRDLCGLLVQARDPSSLLPLLFSSHLLAQLFSGSTTPPFPLHPKCAKNPSPSHPRRRPDLQCVSLDVCKAATATIAIAAADGHCTSRVSSKIRVRCEMTL